jgi:DNA polymerase III alpha subunit (gram-positive type)
VANKNEIYISVDIETNGPIPGPYSMLSLGAVAFDSEGNEIDEFTVNLKELEGAREHPATMKWWATQPKEVWEAARKGAKSPDEAMNAFYDWIMKYRQDNLWPVMVAAPAGFDFTFLNWYFHLFVGNSPTKFNCVDMRSYIMAARKVKFHKTQKRYWPKRWFPEQKHTHVALDDAREQGHVFMNALKEHNRV